MTTSGQPSTSRTGTPQRRRDRRRGWKTGERHRHSSRNPATARKGRVRPSLSLTKTRNHQHSRNHQPRSQTLPTIGATAGCRTTERILKAVENTSLLCILDTRCRRHVMEYYKGPGRLGGVKDQALDLADKRSIWHGKPAKIRQPNSRDLNLHLALLARQYTASPPDRAVRVTWCLRASFQPLP